MVIEEKNMNSKICVVTGASDGIGKATALGLAKMEATVVMVGRNRKRLEDALAETKKKSGSDNLSFMIADLSSQISIRQLASDLVSKYSSLHVLINNAGIIPKTRIVTEDGLETQFAVNHLGYFLLTNLLLDLLKANTPARIINVSSGAHRNGSINFDDLSSEKSYDSSQVYANTKLANVLFTYEMARRLGNSNLTANCLHPGVIATKLLDHAIRTPKLLRFSHYRQS